MCTRTCVRPINAVWRQCVRRCVRVDVCYPGAVRISVDGITAVSSWLELLEIECACGCRSYTCVYGASTPPLYTLTAAVGASAAYACALALPGARFGLTASSPAGRM